MSPILEVIDLGKRFGDVVALDQVSFQVARGEIFGLLGPNGAGKTTLLSIAAGLLEATAGAARVLGEKVCARGKAVRRHIGIVPQELALYPELTARENLEFFGQLYGLARARRTERTAEVLESVGLSDRAESRVNTFSGGMKRRLNLAVALMHAPPLLLLDEPTTGVDPQSRNHIFEEVRRLHAAGATVVYTSHYMEEVQPLCTRVAILDRGRLIACSTMADLLRLQDGALRFRVPDVTPALRDRLSNLSDARLVERADRPLELVCRNVSATLIALLAVLNELKLELLSLETEEPNLERIFLDLTGSTPRD